MSAPLASWFGVVIVLCTVSCAGGDVSSGSNGSGSGGRTNGSGGTGGRAFLDDAGIDGNSSVCPTLESCSGVGGRGNVCGGVISGPHFLYGSAFDKYEGARIVGAGNHTTVKDGSFMFDAGDHPGCYTTQVAYRIDVSPNGRCDDGTDLVFLATSGGSGDFYITGDSPGTPSTCSQFPSGYDLDLAVEPRCFQSCGHVDAAIFDNGNRVGDVLHVYLDVPSLSYTIMGNLTANHTYELRYLWVGGFACNGTASAVWRHTFTAAQGITTLPIVADSTARPGPCL
jgi:hypothetical protein